MSYVQWRAYVGPYYQDYDWSRFDVGDSVLDGMDPTVGTALTVRMESGETVATVASAAVGPAVGWAFIGRLGTGEAWEYVTYTGKTATTLTGLVRESTTTREHNGVHTNASPVLWWYPITEDDGELQLSEPMDGTLSAITWTATIRGVKFPQMALRNGHVIVVQTRASHTGAWLNTLIGFIDSPHVRDDSKRYAEWNIRIVSIAELVAKQPIKGIKVGDLDMAKHGSATGTAGLQLAFDERQSGDYTAAAPDFSAASVTDDDTDSLWIADRYMGSANTPIQANGDDSNDGDVRFSQIYINPPPGTRSRARWIELCKIQGSFEGLSIFSATGNTQGAYQQWTFPTTSGVTEGGLIILCEDEDVFTELNPAASPDAILVHNTFFDSFLPTAGELYLRFDQLNIWQSRVQWGDGSREVHHEDLTETNYGPTVAAPAQGETMRYIYTPAVTPVFDRDYWITGMTKTPGYAVNTTPVEWVMVTLPGIGLQLGEDITASTPGPGGLLKITDVVGTPSTSGLAATGTLQIGDEQISYSAKSEAGVTVTSRAANSTIASAHDAEDLVYVVDGGIATDAPVISSLGWRRFNGTIYPKNFVVRRSNLPGDARTPEETSYTSDWATVATVTNNAASSYTFTFGTPARVKHILIEISVMTVDPARPRLNEIFAIVDGSLYTSTTWLSNGVTAGSLIALTLQNGSAPAGAITVEAGTPALSNITTADDSAWNVAQALAGYSGCRLTVTRDSKITIAPDTYWAGSPVTSHVWTDLNAAAVEVDLKHGLGVSQTKLHWRKPDDSASGVEVYPATEDTIGSPLETEELLYASSLAAAVAARKKFYLARYPVTALTEAADGWPTMRSGEIHGLQWQLNSEMQEINRVYMVASAEHLIKRNDWSTVVSLTQIEREAAN